jgi:hypothetical protein
LALDGWDYVMRISRYKNVTKKDIVILLDGKKVTIKPNQFIEGSDILSSYSGLLKINKPIKEPDIILAKPEVITEIEEYDFNSNIVQESKEFPNINQENEIVYEMIKYDKSEKHMSKIDLRDVTFTIPLSIESEDRKKNLTILLDYLYKYFDTNVIICESDKEMKIKQFWKQEWSSFCRLLFLENKTSFFYKTRLLNTMTKTVKTDIVVSYDSDVLLPPLKYVEAANKIRSKELDFCYPFNKPLKHIEKDSLLLLYKSLDLDMIDAMTKITHQGIPPGGCFFMNKEKFIAAGMENENMVSWGPEDQERLSRIKKLNYNVGSIDGHLYHMDHMITQNSYYSNPLYQINVTEFEKIKRMSELELRQYIKGFSWLRNP